MHPVSEQHSCASPHLTYLRKWVSTWSFVGSRFNIRVHLALRSLISNRHFNRWKASTQQRMSHYTSLKLTSLLTTSLLCPRHCCLHHLAQMRLPSLVRTFHLYQGLSFADVCLRVCVIAGRCVRWVILLFVARLSFDRSVSTTSTRRPSHVTTSLRQTATTLLYSSPSSHTCSTSLSSSHQTCSPPNTTGTCFSTWPASLCL